MSFILAIMEFVESLVWKKRWIHGFFRPFHFQLIQCAVCSMPLWNFVTLHLIFLSLSLLKKIPFKQCYSNVFPVFSHSKEKYYAFYVCLSVFYDICNTVVVAVFVSYSFFVLFGLLSNLVQLKNRICVEYIETDVER